MQILLEERIVLKKRCKNYVLLHTNNSLKCFPYLNAAYFAACLSQKSFSSMCENLHSTMNEIKFALKPKYTQISHNVNFFRSFIVKLLLFCTFTFFFIENI